MIRALAALAGAEPRTLRHRILHAAPRLTRGSRQRSPLQLFMYNRFIADITIAMIRASKRLTELHQLPK